MSQEHLQFSADGNCYFVPKGISLINSDQLKNDVEWNKQSDTLVLAALR